MLEPGFGHKQSALEYQIVRLFNLKYLPTLNHLSTNLSNYVKTCE
jgi:hypothetical protein